MARPPVVVVFDVNVYVDLAELVPQPFSWDDLVAAASGRWNEPVPHLHNAVYDSLRAVLMSRSGRLGTGEMLEVWTSEHIDKLVIEKVIKKVRDVNGQPWSRRNAEHFHDELVNTLVFDMTKGGSVGRVPSPLNNPPLDAEDGYVMRTAVQAGDVVESARYCVTRDGPFRTEYRQGLLEPSVEVLFPHEWVSTVRRAQRPNLGRS